MKKFTFILFILSGFWQIAIAQDFPFGTFNQDDLDMKTYSKDTSAHAVVLREFGRSHISPDLKIIFEYHVRIKIFDAKGFESARVEIPAYDNYRMIDSISGVTFYVDDHGISQKTELNHKNIYSVVENNFLAYLKFEMPALQKGCVIEYKYRIESPNLDSYHPWYFQDLIPKIYSEYEAHIPAYFNYNASLNGSLKLTRSTTHIENSCFRWKASTCDCSVMHYVMEDVPAFKTEDYITSPRNFFSAINFDLVQLIDPRNIAMKHATKEWKDIDYLLQNYYSFGGQLKRTGIFNDVVKAAIAEQPDSLTKARAVYKFIQKWFKWNKYKGATSRSIEKAFEKHVGSVGDINLSLVAALNAAGFNAEAVLLSTRENGLLNPLFPSLSGFDYVIAKVNIDNHVYLLDATDPLLAFGLLPFKCLNDKGRVFSLDKPSYWIDLNLNQRKKTTYSLDLTLQADGKIKGILTRYSVGYDAYAKRVEVKKFNSNDEYVASLRGKIPRLKITKAEITNLDSLDLPLSEKYDIEIMPGDELSNGRLTFNPFFMAKTTTNPFKLAERLYPVDMGMPSEENFILTMHLPPQYTIETPPAKVAVSMPGNGARFLINYETDQTNFTFSSAITFNKSIYNTEDYLYLKDFYNKIIQSEKAEITFKKIQ